MNLQVVIKTVSAQPLAAVRRRALNRDIGHTWTPALDLVWDFLRRHKDLRADGHNCFLYHHPAHSDGTIDIDFGVHVIRTFEGEGEVICTETPAGEVAMATHVGSYDKLAAAYAAPIRGARRPVASSAGARGKYTAIGPTTRRSSRRHLFARIMLLLSGISKSALRLSLFSLGHCGAQLRGIEASVSLALVSVFPKWVIGKKGVLEITRAKNRNFNMTKWTKTGREFILGVHQ
ncbi:MAG: GyrI-like domain-containing protein [Chloracidobacterium sp.]|nr:GyrI-like domain-containing protein [Chloracidobacterium sp.]